MINYGMIALLFIGLCFSNPLILTDASNCMLLLIYDHSIRFFVFEDKAEINSIPIDNSNFDYIVNERLDHLVDEYQEKQKKVSENTPNMVSIVIKLLSKTKKRAFSHIMVYPESGNLKLFFEAFMSFFDAKFDTYLQHVNQSAIYKREKEKIRIDFIADDIEPETSMLLAGSELCSLMATFNGKKYCLEKTGENNFTMKNIIVKSEEDGYAAILRDNSPSCTCCNEIQDIITYFKNVLEENVQNFRMFLFDENGKFRLYNFDFVEVDGISTKIKDQECRFLGFIVKYLIEI